MRNLFVIICIVVAILSTSASQAYANNFDPLPASYPENKTIQMYFSYKPPAKLQNITEGLIHIGLFNSGTKNPIKYASFFVTVKKDNYQLM
ncbi:MAG: hypothetical protein KGL95_02890, partial [Patescibacteria group bacterium]|nr:hypothetical protein [Patescibacteria group bacterium]